MSSSAIAIVIAECREFFLCFDLSEVVTAFDEENLDREHENLRFNFIHCNSKYFKQILDCFIEKILLLGVIHFRANKYVYLLCLFLVIL